MLVGTIGFLFGVLATLVWLKLCELEDDVGGGRDGRDSSTEG